MSNHQAVLRAILRQDLPSFIAKCFSTLEGGRPYRDNWHIHHMAHQLTRVSSGELRRLIINVPPRHLKSICVTVAYTAWRMGHDPSLKVITVSYAEELARTHATAFRTIVDSDWYRATFPAFALAIAQQSKITTTLHGHRLATSVGGPVLGLGADLIVVDDPIKAQDALSAVERRKVKEFYDNTLSTRLNDKATGQIVIVMQRLHEDDLVGHVLAKEPWEVSRIPAIEIEDTTYRVGLRPNDVHRRKAGELIHADREDGGIIEQARRNLGSMSFEAQYQQQPVPPGGNVIKREWLRYYDTVPALDLTMVSWDTASTLGERSDYSVGTVWGLRGADMYLLDVIRGRMEVPELQRAMVEAHRRHEANATLIEATDIGRAIMQQLRRGGRLRPIMYKPKYDKEARLLAQSPKFEAGQVLFPREAPWLGPYVSELLAFPNGGHDDQVDSTSQALDWLSHKVMARREPTRANPSRQPQRPRTQVSTRQVRQRRAEPRVDDDD